MDSIQKYGQEYIDGCRESNSRTDALFGNGDGALQANELALDMSSIFLKDSRFGTQGKQLYKEIESFAAQYAFDNGVISPAAKADLINSGEWGSIIDKFKALFDEKKYMDNNVQSLNNDSAKQYYNEGKEAMQNLDLMHGNGDGKVTPNEYFNNSWGTYKNLFKDDPVKLIKSFFIAFQQANIMAKYTDPDGVLRPSGYMQGLNSEEYGKTLDAYWDLRGGRPQ